MTCCAAGPCDRYLATAGQLPHLRRRACGVCWQREHPQPETLLARRARLKREAAKRALAVAHGVKQPTFATEVEEEHYGLAELPTRVRGDPTTRKRHRDGPNRVAPSQWVPPV